MKIRKLLAGFFAASLLLTTACKDDEILENDIVKGAYQGGILLGVEGGFNKNQAEVSYLSSDLSTLSEYIYASNNDNQPLGDVLQTIAFKDDKAYLVVNNSNKVEVVDRYTFKKTATFQAEQARGIAFAGNYVYVTSNDFFSTYAVNVYNATTFAPVKKLSFDRYAEKIVTVGDQIVVQTDGSTYEMTPPYNEIPTGHTITTINSTTNTVDKTITLTDNGIINDMISANGFAYVLSTENTDSYIYEVNTKTGTFTSSKLAGIKATKLRFADNKLFFADSDGNIYSKGTAANTTATKLFKYAKTTGLYLYGLNIIDDKVYISDVNFNGPSKVMIYSLQGNVIKTLSAGIGVNGFYKN